MEKWYNDFGKKARICKILLFECGEHLLFSVTKRFYICSHYNSGELPMLSDFYLLKSQLNIVGKSFVTIGKPLRIYNANVNWRDTMLYQPRGYVVWSEQVLYMTLNIKKLKLHLIKDEWVTFSKVINSITVILYYICNCIVVLIFKIKVKSFK